MNNSTTFQASRKRACKKRIQKRGQVTLFVIIGLILVIGASLFIYLRNRSVHEPNIDIPRLEGDAGQIQLYVESCLNQVGTEGLTKLGMHGGYIDPLNKTYTPFGMDYDVLDQTESDMAFLNKLDESSGIPYWYYARSSESCWHCEISSLSPSISFMEYQLGRYVDENLMTCLNDFQEFEDKGFDINSITNSTTTVAILDSSVSFLTNYTIQISRNGEIKYIEQFYQDVDIPLLQYYLIAVNITQTEIDTEYLDYYSSYLLGQYGGLDSRKLPPISAYKAGYDTVFWSKTSVHNLYGSLLNSYTQFFRIKGTKNDINYTLSKNPLESSMYASMQLPMFDVDTIELLDLKNKEINHIYIDSVYLDVHPSKGDLISPFVTKDTSEFSKVMGSVSPDQNYEFFYDISYPVVVEIKDARPGKGYVFMFALQSNIKQNKLLSDWLNDMGTIPWNTDYVKAYDNIPNGTIIVDSDTGENTTYEPITETKKFFCDTDQRLSGNIQLKTYDAITSMPLDGVSMSYYCGTYAGCYIDITTYNATLNKSSVTAKLPLCMNGYVKLEKDGYLAENIPLTTRYGESFNIGSVYMEPIISKPLAIQKYTVLRSGNVPYILGEAGNLSSNDSVLLTFSRITHGLEEPWKKTIILGKDNLGITTTNIDLVPGAYTLSAQLLDYTGVIIPKECQKVDTKGKSMLIPSSDIIIDVAMWGGIEFNESNPVIINTADLVGNNTLELYVVRMPDPRCLNDMDDPSLTGYMAKRYRAQLEPRFI